VTIGVEFGSRIVPVGPPASLALNINDPSSTLRPSGPTAPSSQPASPTIEAVSQSKQPQQPQQHSSSASTSPAAQKHMKLSCWDTAGQESYKSITRSYFRGASGALLVFDITRRATFTAVTSWLNDLRQIAEENVIVVLVGNKCDLADAAAASNAPNRREVTRDEAEEWCRANQVLTYVETSAKSGEGVERAFLEVAERIYQNIEAGRYDLNDRRSGVKSANVGNKARTVKLGPSGTPAAGSGAGNGCC